MDQFFGSLADCEWPATPPPYSAGLLSVLFQIERSQWWTPEELASQQFRQLNHVVLHAYRTVPFYRRRFDELRLDPVAVASPNRWADMPLLSRRDIQLSGTDVHSTESPTGHGPTKRSTTSGSTNQPVTTISTGLTELFWRVLTLRDHFWHRRDFSQSLAAIRYVQTAKSSNEMRKENWGPATQGVLTTGPAFLLSIQSTIEEQVRWLLRTNPGYLLSYPSALLAIARSLEKQNEKLPALQGLRTFGEILEPECRAICQKILNVKIVDMYSSQEVGYIALQCPEHEHYHIQSENLLVEILDEAGQQCQAGQTGRVVITTLHNFAMPLLRYDIGDYAEVGEPCPCGRGLPVLKRILGRQRNLLTMPDGQRRWPLFNAGEWPEELPPFFQFQVIQRSTEQIDVLVVRDKPFSPLEEATVRRYMQQTLGHSFEITVHVVEAIPRSRTGKFEDFISEVS
ncbi:MAG: phenylacetate--CoA ligase family protein [Planctomycetota bacterium]|nr:phenylacetate--CoA ligase family protein [Planctomycetota bacterium]